MQNNIFASPADGSERIIDWVAFRAAVRKAATVQPFVDDGGVKVIENVNILSFDNDSRLTFIIDGTSYTFLPDGDPAGTCRKCGGKLQFDDSDMTPDAETMLWCDTCRTGHFPGEE